MNIHDDLLKNGEKVLFDLRALYRTYGYTQYKMSKFEEYDLYVRNKDFLVSDGIITFTDTNGHLMALKPDVTLSIIKNSKDQPGVTQKVFYNENVYRVSRSTHAFKEIMQTGLECIGDLDLFSIAEVILLAAQSLARIRPEFLLDISHMGVVLGLLDQLPLDPDARTQAVHCIGEKNVHGLRTLCAQHNIVPAQSDALEQLVTTYGKMDEVLQKLRPLCTQGAMADAWEQLSQLSVLLKDSGFADRVRFDFSVVNDMNYYNGIVFQGFVDGIPSGVLSGGQYDNLMRKMGRKSGAIGFAVCMDLLERLSNGEHPFDVDTLLLYDTGTDCADVLRAVRMLTENGKTVLAEKAVPEGLRCRQMLKLKNRGLEILENHG